MIIESILTTLDEQGRVNIAPMGVDWGDDVLVIKPFLETTTFRNVRATRVAVINLTDDVLIFARTAIADAACSWREVEVVSIDDTPPRSRIETRVVHHGTQREFLGFNRARNAVLEAAILSTRTHLLPADEILGDFRRLQVIVDKTAGPREHEAMALLTAYVRDKLSAPATRAR